MEQGITSEQIKKHWAADDICRWRWLRRNQHWGLVVMLDNDDTHVVWPHDEDLVLRFDDHTGNDKGLCSLLRGFTIKFEVY